jgi:hypothetical protein
MRIRPQSIGTSVLLVVIAQGIVMACPLAAVAQDRHASANDTAIFAAVVRSIRDSVHMGRLLVDPRAVETVGELTTSPPELADVSSVNSSAVSHDCGRESGLQVQVVIVDLTRWNAHAPFRKANSRTHPRVEMGTRAR